MSLMVTPVLITLAVWSVWWPALRVGAGVTLIAWPFIAGAALASALAAGSVTPLAAAWVALGFAVAAASRRATRRPLRVSLMVLAVSFAFALGARWVPGIAETILFAGLQASAQAEPMRITAHTGAGLAGLLLLAFYCRRAAPPERAAVLRAALGPALVVTLVVLGAAWAVGFVRPDPKLPWFTAIHLLKILAWTCVLEEALFRGVLQDRLMDLRLFNARPWMRLLPVLLPALVFGLVHARGGWLYVGLATLAGVGYGWVYARSRRIEAAIVAHFAVNAAHFLFFTYPSVKPT